MPSSRRSFLVAAARRRPGSWLLWAGALVVVCALFGAGSASAQFRNNGVIMPSVGYHSMGVQDIGTQLLGNTLDDFGAGFIEDFEWNTTGHLTLGAGYFRAIGYNLWWVNEVAVGGGIGIKYSTPFPPPVFSVHVSTGLRYNFLDEEYRPFVSGHVHYLHLISVPGANLPTNQIQDLSLGAAGSFWVGARLGGGFEWFFIASLRKWGVDVPIFYDEMSVQAEGNVAGFINLASPLVSAVGRVSYVVYF